GANRVREENDGWCVAMGTFSFGRGTAVVGELLRTRELVGRLVKLAPDDAGVRRELGHIVAELDALWALTKRNVTQAERGGSVPGLGGSVFKLAYSELRHRLGDLAMRVLGPDALTLEDEHVQAWIQAMSLTIAAGTSQVQRNLAA